MGNNVYSDNDFRDGFLHGAAKAFFAMAYADFVEDEEREDDGYKYPRPRAGQDWMDFLPEIPPNAYALAGELWAGLYQKNGAAGPYTLAETAATLDGDPVDAEDFGHCLAMQAMGTGVSWFDDHRSFRMSVPSMEVSFFSFDFAAYREHG